MSDLEKIQLFENKKVRTAWDEREEKWYFSIVDVCGVLTDQPTPKRASTYWAVLKGRLKKEGAGEMLTTCKQLKLTAADGKPYPTDTADAQTMFRIIQSIPNAEKAAAMWPFHILRNSKAYNSFSNCMRFGFLRIIAYFANHELTDVDPPPLI